MNVEITSGNSQCPIITVGHIIILGVGKLRLVYTYVPVNLWEYVYSDKTTATFECKNFPKSGRLVSLIMLHFFRAYDDYLELICEKSKHINPKEVKYYTVTYKEILNLLCQKYHQSKLIQN